MTGIGEKKMDFRREKTVLFCGFLCLAAAALCLKSDLAEAAVTASLERCAGTIIPALFPFMVLNAVWVQSGFAAQLGCRLERLTAAVFGISGCGAPFLLGILGGFPLGAECICTMTARGDCSREEGERMLAFCSNTGPSFLVSGVGTAMFGSTKTGLILYFSQLISAALTGWIFRLIFGRIPPGTVRKEKIEFRWNMLVSAISASAVSMLKICGFITAFGVMTALIGAGLEQAAGELPPILRAVLYGSMELTAGAVWAARAGGLAGVTVCGAICGWAGFSVHMQTMAAVREQGLKLGGYYRGKLLQSLLCACITLLFCKLF